MTDFLTALALVLVIEGVLYALFPSAMRRLIVEALTMPENRLRAVGLVTAVAGVGLVWLLRGA
ncbi:DUF2065 domain-containing protein [Azospirillum brasilense]|uniref:DUF2065 domain-containing protein n=1 Tax=Azospirillum brasilense TaxID=192 RepID=A0A0N7I7M6_AZOBR|nr:MULTISPECIES: DUF2065 domain-containing protein [Azospirillum]ALJ34915.1 hypothetical protein AMK58_05480 [Azospirillum brasilense]MDW7553398.1 DUF2065 domain-containing protein [Azospirillum brasilense]MDW7594396.1 DUF2065 domain-containing protein [Azospirillum brasilense]MDW7629268.1 DUF2065 domain-containing protein [Azospirillum brasilense]MDX5953589.1 DUF2065 domain-containing protein [Azospirillum brasilense]